MKRSTVIIKPLSKKFWFRDMFNRYNIPLQKEAFSSKTILLEKNLSCEFCNVLWVLVFSHIQSTYNVFLCDWSIELEMSNQISD